MAGVRRGVRDEEGNGEGSMPVPLVLSERSGSASSAGMSVWRAENGNV